MNKLLLLLVFVSCVVVASASSVSVTIIEYTDDKCNDIFAYHMETLPGAKNNKNRKFYLFTRLWTFQPFWKWIL